MTQPLPIIDYAKLALNVYHESRNNIVLTHHPRHISSLKAFSQHIKNKVPGWTHLQFPSITLNPSQGFYAELYIKTNNNTIEHVMLAVRGTVPSKITNITEDLVTWWRAVLENKEAKLKLPSYFTQLKKFVSQCNQVLSLLQQHNWVTPDTIFHATGHSLGGALASLIPATGLSFFNKPIHVVSFNPPGIGSMPIYTDAISQSHVLCIRARYDFVSAVGEPYGQVINMTVPEGYTQAKAAFDSHNPLDESIDMLESFLQQHSLLNLTLQLCKHPASVY